MFRCLSVCLPEVTHRKRHNRLKSKKLEGRESWAASIVSLSLCLPEVTHRKRHNRLKSKKKPERDREGERWVASIVPLSAGGHTQKKAQQAAEV